MGTARRLRIGDSLPASPKRGDRYIQTGVPDPDAICLADGVWTLHGGSISHDTLTIHFNTAASGTTYFVGMYDFGSTDDDFNPGISFGDVNSAHASVVFLVQAAGAGGGDTTIQISGTSILGGTRTPADTEDLVVSDAGAAGTFYQTTKRWNGQVTITKTAGPDLLCGYGFAAFFDRASSDYILTSIGIEWFGGANDSAFDFQLLLHSANGWTYNVGAAPTPAAPAFSSLSDLSPENEVVNGKSGGWGRGDNLAVAGSSDEGLIARSVTGTNNSIERGTILVTIVP